MIMQEELARKRAAQPKPWRPKQPINRKAKFCGIVVSYTVGIKGRGQQSLLQQYTISKLFMLHVRLDSNY